MSTNHRPAPSVPRSLGLKLNLAAVLRKRTTGALVLGAVAVALAAAGCGGSSTTSSTTSSDPATVMPASALLYLGATLRPGEPLASNAKSVASTLSGKMDPFGTLVTELTKSAKHPVDWKTDVDPWLGKKIGFFLTSFGGPSGGGLSGLVKGGVSTSPFGKGVEGALVIDTKDASAAQSFLNKDASYSSPKMKTYRGVSYEVTSDGTAEGIVGGFAVVGSEAGLHDVIDTVKGAPRLSDSVNFTRLSSAEPDSTLISLYLDIDGVLNSLATMESSSSAQTLAVIHALLDTLKLHSIDIAVGAPSDHTLGLSAITPGGGSSGVSSGAQATGAQVLAELPADSWLALGVSHFGSDASQALSLLDTLAAAGGANLQQALSELSAAGFDVQTDLLSWMGGAGLFVRGTTAQTLQAAIVIDSTNPALSHEAVVKLAELLSAAGLDVTATTLADTNAAFTVTVDSLPIVVASGESKFVIGLGTASVASALGPPGTLQSSSQYAAAKSALGGIEPSLLLNFQTLTNVLNATGLANNSTISPAMSTLETLGLLAGGDHAEGATEQLRLALDLQQ